MTAVQTQVEEEEEERGLIKDLGQEAAAARAAKSGSAPAGGARPAPSQALGLSCCTADLMKLDSADVAPCMPSTGLQEGAPSWAEMNVARLIANRQMGEVLHLEAVYGNAALHLRPSQPAEDRRRDQGPGKRGGPIKVYQAHGPSSCHRLSTIFALEEELGISARAFPCTVENQAHFDSMAAAVAQVAAHDPEDTGALPTETDPDRMSDPKYLS
jgi:hypothetical protein